MDRYDLLARDLAELRALVLPPPRLTLKDLLRRYGWGRSTSLSPAAGPEAATARPARRRASPVATGGPGKGGKKGSLESCVLTSGGQQRRTVRPSVRHWFSLKVSLERRKCPGLSVRPSVRPSGFVRVCVRLGIGLSVQLSGERACKMGETVGNSQCD